MKPRHCAWIIPLLVACTDKTPKRIPPVPQGDAPGIPRDPTRLPDLKLEGFWEGQTAGGCFTEYTFAPEKSFKGQFCCPAANNQFRCETFEGRYEAKGRTLSFAMQNNSCGDLPGESNVYFEIYGSELLLSSDTEKPLSLRNPGRASLTTGTKVTVGCFKDGNVKTFMARN